MRLQRTRYCNSTSDWRLSVGTPTPRTTGTPSSRPTSLSLWSPHPPPMARCASRLPHLKKMHRSDRSQPWHCSSSHPHLQTQTSNRRPLMNLCMRRNGSGSGTVVYRPLGGTPRLRRTGPQTMRFDIKCSRPCCGVIARGRRCWPPRTAMLGSWWRPLRHVALIHNLYRRTAPPLSRVGWIL
jgi:hypothetical protein